MTRPAKKRVDPRSPVPADPAADAESGSPALRALSGGGPSKVGVVGAMRARDVSRPRSAGQPPGGLGSSGRSPDAS